jgi:hypothetical protein
MKTSNKLLIAFAAALILIPILCIAFVSRVYYEKGAYTSNMNETDSYGPEETVPFPPNGSAESITVQDKSGIHLIVAINRDGKSGLKVSNNLKGLVTVQTDANGQLQISVKSSKEEIGNLGKLTISAPLVRMLNISGSKGLSLQAEVDSLNLNLSNIGSVEFKQQAKLKYLEITTTKVNDISFAETNSLSASLNLNNTNVRSDLSSFDNLVINSAGTSIIELNGGENGVSGKTINNFNINTLGKTDLKVLNMVINQCSGKFSDSTSVQMPAININQMYKVKK